MDLVEEEDRPASGEPEPLLRAAEHLADVLHRGRDGGELFELGSGRDGDDACERRLAGARRSVEDRRADAVLRDREAERRAFAEHVLLADELVERARPEALRERRGLSRALGRSVGEEVAHDASMLRTWPRPALPTR